MLKYYHLQFCQSHCPYYLNKIFEFIPHCSIDTRNKFSKLKNPFRKTNMGQKAISYIGPSIWNSLPDSIRWANSLNSFKHNFKKHYLTWITNNAFMWIYVSVFIYMFKCPWVCLCIHMHIRQCIFLWLIHSQVILFLCFFVCFFVFLF